MIRMIIWSYEHNVFFQQNKKHEHLLIYAIFEYIIWYLLSNVRPKTSLVCNVNEQSLQTIIIKLLNRQQTLYSFQNTEHRPPTVFS